MIFSDYILYLKKEKWVRFWVALVSQEEKITKSDKTESKTLKKKKTDKNFSNSHMRLIVAPNKFVDEQVSLNLENGEWRFEKLVTGDKEFSFRLFESHSLDEYVFACQSLDQLEQWTIELDHFTKMAFYKSTHNVNSQN